MIRINQIKINPLITKDEDKLNKELTAKIAKALKITPNNFTYKIVKKSVDSRKKPDILIIFSVDVTLINLKDCDVLKRVNDNNIMLSKTVIYQVPAVKRNSKRPRPVIIGFGPAGMFCALMLARAGIKPIVLERGEAVEDRIISVNNFWNGGQLNTESNAQFGEGGAGTFSDGKLNTQVKEVYGRISKVLEIFVEHGASEEITYEAKPHIGTDKLVSIVKNIREEIISLGGEVIFNTKLTDIKIENGKVTSIIAESTKTNTLVKTTEYVCDTLVLAIGHSARDTFYMLKDKVTMEAKAFAMGLRIEHPQELININEFGDGEYKDYMPASYKVTHKASNGRGIYSFCMCPGGYVVNASSEEGLLAVNGMSYSGRDSGNANSALIVTVDERDYGSDDVLAGIKFQRRLEQAAYNLCNGAIPVQRLGDFKDNISTTDEGLSNNLIKPRIKGSYKPANIRSILPKDISDTIIEGVGAFNRQIKGFDNNDALFSGIESRTSSPVRILRGDDYMGINVSGLYPCGEGAGYAGGITSAAVDGIKVYEAIVSTQ